MSSEGTDRRPHVDFDKIREFLREDCTWIQRAAVNALARVSANFGSVSIPIGEDLVDAALRSRSRDVRVDCQIMVQNCVRNGACVPGIMAKLREEAENEGGGHDRFLMETAIIAILAGHVQESAEVLASVIHRDIMPPERRQGVYRMLEYSLGKGKDLEIVWGAIARAILEKERGAEVSQIRNLQDLMRPPASFGRSGVPALQDKPRKLARS